MTTDGQRSLAQRLTGIDEIECVTPDLNGVPRGKVMTAEGFLEGRRLQMARGVLLQCIMGGYPPSRFYGSDDGDLALVADPKQIHRLPWSHPPRALAICDADELSGESSPLSTRGQLKAVIARYAALGLAPVVATELEFFVFAANPDPAQPFRPPVGLDGRREDGQSAFSVSSNNGLRPFFTEVYECMAALGLPRDTFMHEMGVSQFEINLLHGDPLLLADQTFLWVAIGLGVGYRAYLATQAPVPTVVKVARRPAGRRACAKDDAMIETDRIISAAISTSASSQYASAHASNNSVVAASPSSRATAGGSGSGACTVACVMSQAPARAVRRTRRGCRRRAPRSGPPA